MIFYRYYVYYTKKDKLSLICLWEYEKGKVDLFKSPTGDCICFDTKEKGIEWLNKRIKRKCIHKDFRYPNVRNPEYYYKNLSK